MWGFEEQWEMEDTARIPLLGEVAAGQPLEVFSVEETLDVPESLWKGRKVFALRVRGRSMADAGIRDGDYLIVEPCETADNGRTVVAEIDGHVTVKKFYREPDGQIRLQPANSEMLPLVASGEDVRIRGLVVGVLRKYGFRPAEQDARPAPPEPAPGFGGPRKTLRSAGRDEATLELSLNAIDTRLALARQRLASSVQLTSGQRSRLAELARDLQALREWCGRTSKASLRRALLADAARLMQRMQRILTAHDSAPPDTLLH